MTKINLVVSVDFDGTITKAAEPQERGFNKIRPHCKEVMDKLSALGVKFVLLTARDWYLNEALELCKKWQLPLDLSHPNRMTKSDFYINDKSIFMPEVDWKKIYKKIIGSMIV